jgi:hypothetical protein
MHLLPLDRRTIFSRNVFCGATSPLLPPAMVILLTARGLGGVPGRLLTAAGSWARSPRAFPAPSAPCAPRGTGGQGRRLTPAATVAPGPYLPSCGPPGSALVRGSARCSRLRVGGGSRAPGSTAPPTGRASPARLRETKPRRPPQPGVGGGGKKGGWWVSRLRPQRHPLSTAEKCVQAAYGAAWRRKDIVINFLDESPLHCAPQGQ